MLRIGDFARLAQLPVKTLRYYDDLGLIAPAYVDSSTGYRYYTAEQLPRLNKLLALKDLGFSLEQIAEVLIGVTPEQLRGMLMLQRAASEHRVKEEQDRLSRIEARLRSIELEDDVPEYDVVLKTVAPMIVAGCRIRIPENHMVPERLGAAYKQAYDHIRDHRGKALEPCMALWYTTADTYTDEDAEAVVPVDAMLPDGEHVKVYELSGGTFASAVHQGDFAGFTQLHGAILRWIDASGYSIVGPTREVYVQWADHANSLTEVQYPVQKP